MKVSELQGALLDYWVAKAERLPICAGWNASTESGILVGTGVGDMERYAPSTRWEYGGPILEKRNIGFFRNEHGNWVATMLGIGQIPNGVGPTPLVAAMRAYVWMTCGDEVPDEATNT